MLPKKTIESLSSELSEKQPCWKVSSVWEWYLVIIGYIMFWDLIQFFETTFSLCLLFIPGNLNSYNNTCQRELANSSIFSYSKPYCNLFYQLVSNCISLSSIFYYCLIFLVATDTLTTLTILDSPSFLFCLLLFQTLWIWLFPTFFLHMLQSFISLFIFL